MSYPTIVIKDISGVQVVEIPEDLKIEDDKVFLKKVANVLYIIPYHQPWQSMIDSVEEFSPDYMISRDQPNQQKREKM